MLSRSRHWLFSLSLTLCLLVLVGCQPGGTSATSDQTVAANMSDLNHLVANLRTHHRRPFRKPRRDARARTMRRLVAKTDVMLADIGGGGIESAFSGQASEGNATHESMAALSTSLQELKAAAERKSTAGVLASFRQVEADYSRATGNRGAID